MRQSLAMALAVSLAVLGSNCSPPTGTPDSGTPPPQDAGDTTPVLDVTQCTLSVDRATGVAADGTDRATVTVVVKDSKGNPLAGQAVVLEATGQESNIPFPRFLAPDPSAFISQISVNKDRCPRSDENAICLPSGDHVGY